MLRENFIKTKLEAGKPVIGTWAVIPSTVTIDIMAHAGLDFAIIDAEHGPIGFETAQDMVISCESNGISPIMRVGGVIESDILRALDIGVHGVQIPNVTTASHVGELIQYAKYPPIGNRGFSPFTRAGGYSIESATKLAGIANENTLIAINIEGVEAIDNVDEIFAFDALNIVFVGLFDLSKALGIPGQVNDKRVLDALAVIAEKARKAGKFVGTIATELSQIEMFTDLGLQYIVYLVDVDVMRRGYAQASDELKRVAGR